MDFNAKITDLDLDGSSPGWVRDLNLGPAGWTVFRKVLESNNVRTPHQLCFIDDMTRDRMIS